jgi:H+-transporting ATPase
MAGMDILCSDKTGTLTQNRMTISNIYGKNKNEILKYAIFASKKENNDPIEKPIFEYIEKNNIKLPSFKINKFIPFNPISKRTEAIIEVENQIIISTKGAPQIIVELCNLERDLKKEIYKKIESFANDGFRTLGVAYKTENQLKFTFLGLIPLYDPPRTDSKEAISEAQQNGVKVKMVTGDNISVAKYISQILGIGKNLYSIKELKNETHDEYILLAEIISKALLKSMNLSETEIKNKIDEILNLVQKEIGQKLTKGVVKRHESEIIKILEEANGFAEVYPEDKYFIVNELQKANHIVGMTGDGVNDAPALKKADIGIAVSEATDAARASADIVLLASGLRVIIDAIKEARITFERMKSYTIFRIAETIRVILFMTLSIIIFNFYPVTALMIILLALLNDIPILAIAYDNTKIEKKPVRWDIKEILLLSTWLGIAGVISSFTIFYIIMIYLSTHIDTISYLPAIPEWVNMNNKESWLSFVQTLFFTKLVMAGHWTIFNTRTSEWFFKKPYPNKILLFSSFITACIGVLVGVYGFGVITPIGWEWGIFVIIYTFLWFIFNDFVKRLTLKEYKKREKN